MDFDTAVKPIRQCQRVAPVPSFLSLFCQQVISIEFTICRQVHVILSGVAHSDTCAFVYRLLTGMAVGCLNQPAVNGFRGWPIPFVAGVQMLQIYSVIDIEFAVQWIDHRTHRIRPLAVKLGYVQFKHITEVLSNFIAKGITRSPQRCFFPGR